jgi:hypothetical protein
VLATGRPALPYLQFPPRTAPVFHTPFAWPAFVVLSLPAIASVGLFIVAFVHARQGPSPARRRFPAWAWLGVALIAAGWTLAWSDALAPATWRRQMFTVLWLGYIVFVNGLVVGREGQAPLLHRRGWFLALFAVSAAAWWSFEYLNQFTANWYYTGVEAQSDWAYVLQGTLPFSTVLPAIASTRAWLATFPRKQALALPALSVPRALPSLAVATGVAGLAGVGIWPDFLFPLLWLGPFCILAGLQWMLLGESLLAPLARGDWRPCCNRRSLR